LDGAASLPIEEQYTYIFGGFAQFIDGILLSPALAELVVETMVVHRNADFPYTLGVDTSTAGLPFFFSDHDVPLLLLGLEPELVVPTVEATVVVSAVTATLQPVTPTVVPPMQEESGGSAVNMPLVGVLGLAGGAAVVSLGLYVVLRRLRR
jgi:hypothetical protein